MEGRGWKVVAMKALLLMVLLILGWPAASVHGQAGAAARPRGKVGGGGGRHGYHGRVAESVPSASEGKTGAGSSNCTWGGKGRNGRCPPASG
ncbi:hypothetical protein ACP4OV_023968 [Aristida adscensionis]